jgi:lysophospholipase L1-like esterase
MILDRALRTIAQRTSARYISGPTNAIGELPQEFTWDDVHYNAQGACEVARAVVSVLEGVVE